MLNNNNEQDIHKMLNNFIENLDILNKNLNLGYLRFCLIVANTCHLLQMNEVVEQLCTWLLKNFHEMNDELSCLETLCIVQNNKLFRNEWFELLNKSYYLFFSKQFKRDLPCSYDVALGLSTKVLNYLKAKNV